MSDIFQEFKRLKASIRDVTNILKISKGYIFKKIGIIPFNGISGGAGTSNSYIHNEPLESRSVLTGVEIDIQTIGSGYVFIAKMVAEGYFKLVEKKDVTVSLGVNIIPFSDLAVDETTYIGVYSTTFRITYNASAPGYSYYFRTGEPSYNGNTFTKTSNGVLSIRAIIKKPDIKLDGKTYILKDEGFFFKRLRSGFLPGSWTVTPAGLSSSTAGIGNALIYDRQTNISDKICEMKFTYSASTVVAIISKPKETAYAVAGTIAAFSAVTSRIMFYEAWDGTTILPAVRVDIAVSLTLVEGRSYTLQLKKHDRVNVLTLIDNVTRTSSTSLSTTGTQNALGSYNETYGGGFQHDVYGVAHLAGTTPIIKSLDVYTPNTSEIHALIVGDSITEGYGVNAGQSFAFQLKTALSALGKTCVISGRGGGKIDAVIEKVFSEGAYLKPKYFFVTIGTNGGITQAKLIELVEAITFIGSIPVINRIPMMPTQGQLATNNLIATLGVLSIEFDKVTAINNDVAQGQDTTKFIPEATPLHPTKQTHDAMVAQAYINVPEFFV